MAFVAVIFSQICDVYMLNFLISVIAARGEVIQLMHEWKVCVVSTLCEVQIDGVKGVCKLNPTC